MLLLNFCIISFFLPESWTDVLNPIKYQTSTKCKIAKISVGFAMQGLKAANNETSLKKYVTNQILTFSKKLFR
jgi:hypothetical protein